MTVKVAKANEGKEVQMDVEDVKKWEVVTKNYMGSTVLVKTKEDGTFTMYRDDYDNIFGNKR